jgi:putative oxidoreductase
LLVGKERRMNIVLWGLQILLGVGIFLGGIMKAFFPLERLALRMKWTSDLPPLLVRFIGVVEILGGIGLILPGVTGIMPWLTLLAALGLALIMLLAMVFHSTRGEKLGNASIMLVLSVAVFVGRFLIEPF